MKARHYPFASTVPDWYSRLLPPDIEAAEAATDARLIELADSMKAKRTVGAMAPTPEGIPAGYTYFGQFVDHDVTYDTSSLADYPTEIKPEETRNFRRTALNLENLYGDGPGSRDWRLYEDDNVSFRLGTSDDGRVVDAPLDNIPSDVSLRRPLAADPRNLENALIRQVHAMFLKLHNIAANAQLTKSPARDRFAKARQKVCHQYQWLVRNDFLPRVCDPSVYASVITNADPLIDWRCRFSIPVEFAQAAFRFGHSMVRSEYGLADTTRSVPVGELLGGKNSTGPLSGKHVIDWANFLSPPHARSSEFALPIDTSIIPEFFDLPTDVITTFVRLRRSGDTFSLPHRTMKRGVLSRLPSGQRACNALHERGIWRGGDAWANLISCHLDEHTPLWYYILLEAETNGGGVKLGPLGSRIVAEVIEGALWANPESFLRQYGRLWEPEAWSTPHGTRSIQSLYDVAVVTSTP